MRRFNSSFRLIVALTILDGLSLGSTTARADMELFVSSSSQVGTYSLTGQPIDPTLISGYGGWGVSVSGTNLFVTNGSTVGEYTTSGGTVNSTLVTGLSPGPIRGIAAVGSTLYVSNQLGGAVAQYTVVNGTVTGSNPTFITAGVSAPTGVTVSGSNIFVANFLGGNVTEYNTSGSLVSTITAPNATFVAVSGQDLFVTNFFPGTVSEYTLSGTLVNADLISGLDNPESIVAYGSDLYITNQGNGTVGEYDTSGDTINAALITGLSSPSGITVASVPEPGSLFLLGLTIGVFSFGAWMRRPRGVATAVG